MQEADHISILLVISTLRYNLPVIAKRWNYLLILIRSYTLDLLN